MTILAMTPRPVPSLRAHFAGALVGCAVGDALGERAFYLFRDEPGRAEDLVAEVERLPMLGYTDDTAMTLALARAITAHGAVDTEHVGAALAAEHAHEPWRGYASGPPAIFARAAVEGARFGDLAQALANGEGSFGNGAAMRVSPVGAYFHRASDEALYAAAAASARATHAHPVGIDGAAVIARAIAAAVRHAAQAPDKRGAFPAQALARELTAFARTSAMREKLTALETLLASGAATHVAADKLGRGITADRSVPYALFAFLRAPDSFEETLFGAVLEEGDRDTVGAMACALSGALLGVDAIPAAWRARLEDTGAITATADALFEQFDRAGATASGY